MSKPSLHASLAPPPVAAVRRRVLVVDDNVDAAATLAQLVQLLGHETVVAFDGLQALAAAGAASFDIVLLDLGMPRLDGVETARRLRAAPGGGALFIAAVTGWGQDQDRARTNAAGFDMHLVKPVDVEVLTRLLEQPRPLSATPEAGPEGP